MDGWQKAKFEIEDAYRARENLNEGMARVCARRAAGAALEAYLSAKNLPVPSHNAFNLLKIEQGSSFLPPNLNLILGHLTLRVDVNHSLPAGVDLLQETTDFINILKNTCPDEESNGE